MKLSKEAVEELREIYFKVYGSPLGDGEAESLGIRLLEFFAMVLPARGWGRESRRSRLIGKIRTRIACVKILLFREC